MKMLKTSFMYELKTSISSIKDDLNATIADY